jgi:hypothetical protein
MANPMKASLSGVSMPPSASSPVRASTASQIHPKICTRPPRRSPSNRAWRSSSLPLPSVEASTMERALTILFSRRARGLRGSGPSLVLYNTKCGKEALSASPKGRESVMDRGAWILIMVLFIAVLVGSYWFLLAPAGQGEEQDDE